MLKEVFGVFFYFLICFYSFRAPEFPHFLLSFNSLLHVYTSLLLFWLLPNLLGAIDIYDFQLHYYTCSNGFPLSPAEIYQVSDIFAMAFFMWQKEFFFLGWFCLSPIFLEPLYPTPFFSCSFSWFHAFSTQGSGINHLLGYHVYFSPDT